MHLVFFAILGEKHRNIDKILFKLVEGDMVIHPALGQYLPY